MPTFTRTRILLRPPARQLGVAAVEFSLVAILFFVLFFGIVEIARAMYLCNTLQEVTRRAAALAVNTDFSDDAAMQRVRRQAVFRDTPGQLWLGDPVSDQHIKIDYLRLPPNSSVPVSLGSALPGSPLENRLNCGRDPNAANCIRLVRVRVCLPGGGAGECVPVPYKTLFTLIPFSFPLPLSTTVANIETLGMPPGMPCDC